MKISTLRHSRKGFTLVELIIAMVIMGMMSTMTLLIYFNISETSRRLQISREISETSRQITERIAQDIKKYGVHMIEPNNSDEWNDDYSSADVISNRLNIKSSDDSGSSVVLHSYFYGRKGDSGGIIPCSDEDKTNDNVHCGLIFSNPDSSTVYDLVDSFREEQNRKRVKITDLQFYVTGGQNDIPKVTLKMTLQLSARAGVPPSLIQSTKMEIQTTFSERFYKLQ